MAVTWPAQPPTASTVTVFKTSTFLKMFIYALFVLLPALALAQDPIAQLENKLFGALDHNGDGHVTQQENEAFFLGFDADKDGEISKVEFISAVDKLDPNFAGHEDALYELLDHDDDGEVNKSDIDHAFAVADANKDGQVTKAEFHVVFQAVVSHVG